jgi:branched-chain amino acid transport system substrate-binding protein
LAKKDINIPNTTIQIVEKVTNCEAEDAAKAMREFAAEGVVAVVGEYCSGATLGAAPIANDSHIPLVSASSTSADITGAGDYVFRTIPSDALTGPFTAKAMRAQNLKRLAIIYEAGDDYTEGLRDTVKENFVKAGGQVVAVESHPARASDVSLQMQRIKAANADVLYIASGTDTPVSILTKKKELNLNIPVYSSETLQDSTFINDAGAVANGLNVVTVNVGSQAFVEKHKAAYTLDPDVYTAQSYDAFMSIALAIKSGATTGAAIKDALYKVDFTGASGRIKFDSNGDVAGDHVIYQIQDRKLNLVQ